VSEIVSTAMLSGMKDFVSSIDIFPYRTAPGANVLQALMLPS
jgi:hypothetical protein